MCWLLPVACWQGGPVPSPPPPRERRLVAVCSLRNDSQRCSLSLTSYKIAGTPAAQAAGAGSISHSPLAGGVSPWAGCCLRRGCAVAGLCLQFGLQFVIFFCHLALRPVQAAPVVPCSGTVGDLTRVVARGVGGEQIVGCRGGCCALPERLRAVFAAAPRRRQWLGARSQPRHQL